MSSPETWSKTHKAFAEAAAWFVDTAAKVAGRWEEPGLGEWSVRDLVGHTSRALLTVETYLNQQAASIEVESADEYFRLALASVGDPAAVAERGRDAGAALGSDPAAAVEEIADRVLSMVNASCGDSIVRTPVGGMRLMDYMPTRTFELTVHTCDLAAAIDVVPQVPEAAADQSFALLGRLAIRSGKASELLLAATGRGGLPAGFTVL
ncbi:maleylpyruvate isomerase N-terminal domain-containing protein [Arthrobacter sp. H14]|uniref:maleylpyruvate isomerase N-terminal domain-containing protein n=1 Tax=Arthrobacter sp. H14 TaxID=1312959 RepID=UPI00047D7422|nr:maleylpyruvate isomerase N-terminal domain-containing protein [Arthrobacter sp. H14]